LHQCKCEPLPVFLSVKPTSSHMSAYNTFATNASDIVSEAATTLAASR
jgi:hypothetical protein